MGTIKVNYGPGGSAYLTEIPQVQLNNSFGSSLNDALSMINENFKKMLSLPFLQGDNGNSIFETTFSIGVGGAGQKMKETICQCIYNSQVPNDAPYGNSIRGVSSWSQSNDGTEIAFYRHQETTYTTDKYFYAGREFFLFLDNRVNMLSTLNANSSVLPAFRDLSCAVSITAEAPADPSSGQPDLSNITFSAKKHSIVPTLYYDPQMKHWCWSINGVKTGVIAQGVKGDSGTSKKVYICFGQKTAEVPDPLPTQNNNGIIKIVSILQPIENAHVQKPHTVIRDGDLIVVWFKDEGYGSISNGEIDNCTFGTAKIHSEVDTSQEPIVDNSYVYISISGTTGVNTDLATIMGETTLYRWLNDICSAEPASLTNAHNPSVRGLYIPNGQPFEDNKIHMLWSDFSSSDPVANLGCVSKDKRQLASQSGALPKITIGDDTVSNWATGDSSILALWYPTIRCHKGTFYRKVNNYLMANGASPDSVSVKNYSGKSQTISNLTRDSISSVISLRGTVSENISSEETLISSSGIYIGRKDEGPDSSDVPSLYIDHGTGGKVYIKKGNIVTEDARLYIGPSSPGYMKPTLHNEAKYDGGESEYESVRLDIKNRRWSFSDPDSSLNPIVVAPGIKLSQSDFVVHGGTVIVSSSNGLRNVYLNGNRLMFDYKAKTELEYDNPGDTVKDRRPRNKEYVGIQIGGYNTVFNSVTSNSTTGGEVKDVLDNHQDTITLTDEDNKRYAFLSGKLGYTSMIENWGADDVFYADPPFTVKRTDQNEPQLEPAGGDWGVVTSYDCLWTKVGNVVDVKGKIFLNKCKYTVEAEDSAEKIKCAMETAQPMTYAEIFRFVNMYGNKWVFPLPVVLEYGSRATGDLTLKNSVGNHLNNPRNGEFSRIVNNPKITGWIGNSSTAQTVNHPYPVQSTDSANIYHNEIYNGSAQFHFYGSDKTNVKYGNSLDTRIRTTSANDGMPTGIDILNNVFTVTADISKCPGYSDRWWHISGMPNYDSINHPGTSGLYTTDNNFNTVAEQVFGLNNASLGPVRIVSSEDEDSTRTELDTPSTSAQYKVTNSILGFNRAPAYPNPQAYDAPPRKYTSRAGRIASYDTTVLSTGELENLEMYLKENLLKNLCAYKVSVNIGSYKVRYITFSFSYLLDDDIYIRYDNGYATKQIERVDANAWRLPNMPASPSSNSTQQNQSNLPLSQD